MKFVHTTPCKESGCIWMYANVCWTRLQSAALDLRRILNRKEWNGAIDDEVVAGSRHGGDKLSMQGREVDF